MIAGAFWIPGLPHLLQPEKNPEWARLRAACDELGAAVKTLKPDALLVYSTQWFSVLGTSFQTRARSRGVHVDENWYEYGDLDFDIACDRSMGEACAAAVTAAGFPTKTVDYDSFPIDTGTILAARFLNPDGKIPMSIVSSWVYADAEKSKAIGRAMAAAVASKRVLVVASSLLSTGYWNQDIDPAADKVSRPQEDAANRKLLGLFEGGDLAAVEAAIPDFKKSARTDMQMNAFHWLHGVLGGAKTRGRVLAYGPIWGTGAAVMRFDVEEKQ